MMNSYSRIPTRTSSDTLLDIVRRVGAFYKLPLVCHLDDTAKTASIDLASNSITLPTWLMKANLPKILFYALHEMLHVRVMPCTAHMQAYYVALAAELGVKAPKLLGNLVFDQIVNDNGMAESPFREEFRKGCKAFYRSRVTKLKAKKAEEWANWHFGNMNKRCDEIQEKTARSKKDDLTGEKAHLYELVFKDQRPFEKRFREVCEITKDWFNTQNEDNNTQSAGPCGEGTYPPIEDPGELDEWLQKMRKLSRKSGLKGVRATGNRRVLMDYAEISALEEFIISQSSQARRAKEVGGPSTPDAVWGPEDRVDELDLRKTLQTSGIFLPYVTALKNVPGTETAEESQGTGLQAYVLDVSGSMFTSLDLVAMLCFAISRHARRRRDEIAVLTFSNSETPEFLLKPCRSYDQLRPILEKIEGGGSTFLAPAISWLNEYCAKKQLKPTAILFTDTSIADEMETLREIQRTRDQLRGTSILVNTGDYWPGWVRTATQRKLLEAFQVDENNLGNVQQILRHVA